jgi:hypothetical protein
MLGRAVQSRRNEMMALSAVRHCGRGEIAHLAGNARACLVHRFPLWPERHKCGAGDKCDKCDSDQCHGHSNTSSVRPDIATCHAGPNTVCPANSVPIWRSYALAFEIKYLEKKAQNGRVPKCKQEFTQHPDSGANRESACTHCEQKCLAAAQPSRL